MGPAVVVAVRTPLTYRLTCESMEGEISRFGSLDQVENDVYENNKSLLYVASNVFEANLREATLTSSS